jgi:hypothetical protein
VGGCQGQARTVVEAGRNKAVPATGYVTDIAARRDGRRRWSEKSRAERHAFVQTRVGVWFAIVAFGGSIVLTPAATVIGIRRGRNRQR